MSHSADRCIQKPRIALEHGNPRLLCKSIEKHSKSTFGGDWCVRPWNRFQSDASAWWLIPSTEWPSYKHGKYFFELTRTEPTRMAVGFYFEKGLGARLMEAYSSRRGTRLVMQEDWSWHRAWAGLKTGTFDAIVQRLQAPADDSLWLQISAGYVNDPSSFDPYALRLPHDKASYQWNSFSHSFALDQVHRQNVLPALPHDPTLEDYIRSFDSYQDIDWLWADLSIGIDVGVPPCGPELPVWLPGDLWDRFLCHFSVWLPGMNK